MSARPAFTRRIVLRLDPARPYDGALSSAMHLANALRAELAARMISDTRFLGAFALAGSPQGDSGRLIQIQLRRTEVSLRRALSALAARHDTVWSFEVVRCAGVLAHECSMASDDLVVIELPRFEFSLAALRGEVAETLARARGVVLMPPVDRSLRGPVVAIVGDPARATELIANCAQIAEAIGVPLKQVVHDGQIGAAEQERREAGDIATSVRRLGATLAVIDAADSILGEFLARPRHLRELATPLLLLKSAS